ncbi:UDP-N-acetylglucosamine--N-acetylmuramyl-(pentapeptide) pyrophosphoryl-undecaprenol N-acetylglucosamine transferase [Parvularcula sp. ZS-1/3]|uniref:UDP-N-acetylglucosamine--N-acetylmuramyl-(pentapeptide) pyrophosphoryl-undecaprenol N-acetylglucosamine transferase n=1 Tax=Parvularcula mediterranea TaxID=2732508 RepID=A0A7Y3RJ62_9PROT|nr:UDP-N-acetylglucosamine--N-acetylmuramyl-(pentapeptide) pyrophosphoryl-undecaprenol N-acetylglucosamine transferase [Parvularcula mediterranea]NNU15049.1 UDP-N-acetylglucosamine--N-acetylmuramyl-(pentapeptide) pyrophosphoryl-undecaprenol N-acetylglucosamine transferase [Parvularcula mediterranea]
MKIALAAGGTGGHMFPAQALAEEARSRGWQVMLLTDARGDRYTKDFPHDEKVLLKAASPSASGILAKISAAMTLLGGIGTAKKALKRFGADAVIGFGGYPSAPSMLAAQQSGIATGIHEQNAVLGRANRLAAGKAGFIAHGFPKLDRAPKGAMRLRETGNPVRRAVIEAASEPFDKPMAGGPLHLLIFGGSQGASLFARIFPEAIGKLPSALKDRLRITHQVAEDGIDAARQTYEAAGIDPRSVELAPFFTDLPERIASSHLIVARSGASSVAELSVIGRPSLLVPLKIAMDDHQRMNATVLTDVGAAELILEDDLSVDNAAKTLEAVLSDTTRLTSMADAAKGRMAEGAAAALADLTQDLTAGKLG